jgi:RNA polymerase sigma-70 factor (ECF subfamily)
MSDALLPEEQTKLLLAVARDRDREAFSKLFAHFAPRLKTFLTKPGTTPNTAEELAQETMLLVWRKAGLFDPARAGAATWIFTIARNLRIDQQRRYRPADPLPDPSDEPDRPLDGESQLLVNEREEQIRTALSALSPEQATIIRMSFFDETSHADIAHALEIPLGTVKSRVRLAMNRLRTLLDQTV